MKALMTDLEGNRVELESDAALRAFVDEQKELAATGRQEVAVDDDDDDDDRGRAPSGRFAPTGANTGSDGDGD